MPFLQLMQPNGGTPAMIPLTPKVTASKLSCILIIHRIPSAILLELDVYLVQNTLAVLSHNAAYNQLRMDIDRQILLGLRDSQRPHLTPIIQTDLTSLL